MSRPDPIQYAERLYIAIRAANFSPISFLAFGNAIKDGVDFRRMPRMSAEPFMRVVGEMLDLEEATAQAGEIVDAEVASGMSEQVSQPAANAEMQSTPPPMTASPPEPAVPPSHTRRSPRDRH
jgi:hypothetical protein